MLQRTSTFSGEQVYPKEWDDTDLYYTATLSTANSILLNRNIKQVHFIRNCVFALERPKILFRHQNEIGITEMFIDQPMGVVVVVTPCKDVAYHISLSQYHPVSYHSNIMDRLKIYVKYLIYHDTSDMI